MIGVPPRAVLVTALALALGACSLAPSYVRPESPAPATWAAPALPSTEGVELRVDELTWGDFVRDPALAQIIGTALTHNRDLETAVLAVEAARAQYRVVRSQSEAGLREFLTTAQGARSARLALIAETSALFVRYHAADARHDILARTLRGRIEALGRVESRLHAGVDSEVEVQDAQAVVAEARVHPADARDDLERARNSLTEFLGAASPDFDGLFDSGTRAWRFAPTQRLPIFGGGRNRAQLELAQVRRDTAVVAYEQAIEVAFTEVSNALSSMNALREERVSQLRSAAASMRARGPAGVRHRAGMDNNLRLIEAERRALEERLRVVGVEVRHQEALAGLFKSLSGGWLPVDAIPHTPLAM